MDLSNYEVVVIAGQDEKSFAEYDRQNLHPVATDEVIKSIQNYAIMNRKTKQYCLLLIGQQLESRYQRLLQSKKIFIITMPAGTPMDYFKFGNPI